MENRDQSSDRVLILCRELSQYLPQLTYNRTARLTFLRSGKHDSFLTEHRLIFRDQHDETSRSPGVQLAHRCSSEIFSGRYCLLIGACNLTQGKKDGKIVMIAMPIAQPIHGAIGDSDFLTHHSKVHFALSGRFYERSPSFCSLQIATISPHHRFWFYRRYILFDALK
jgi:hypothetical protein